MDLERAVDEFVARGTNLFRQLRSDGESLSDIGLRILRAQLHVLQIETVRLEAIKLSGASAVEKSPAQRSRHKRKSPHKCSHHRLIDYCLDAEGKRTDLIYCLECGAILEDPLQKAG